MFKVVKLKTILIVVAVVLFTAVIVVTTVLLARRERSAEAFAPLPKPSVIIDAGHGGADPGVMGVKTGIKESELTLKMALVLGDLFTAAGYKAVLTRYGDESTAPGAFDKSADMQARREIIKRVSPDAVISLHMNKYEGTSRRGVQVFYTTEGSKGLAEALQKHLNQTMNVPTLGRGFEAIVGDYYIADNGEIPSVIVECAFLSSPIDEALITDPDYRLRLASEIECSVQNYLKR